MSQYLTMELEAEGPAKRVCGQRRSGDLFFANNLPYCSDQVHAAAERLGVESVFAFAKGLEETRATAQRAVYGKPVAEFGDEDEITDEREDEVDRIYYSTGPWFEPAQGVRSATALIKHFEEHAYELAGSDYGEGVVPDLKQLLAALEEAQRRGRRFRLHYSY